MAPEITDTELNQLYETDRRAYRTARDNRQRARDQQHLAWLAGLRAGDDVAVSRASLWYQSRIVEPTLELKREEAEKKQRQHLVGKLDSVRWRNLPLATLQAVAAALEATNV